MQEQLPGLLFLTWPGCNQKVMVANDEIPIIGKIYHFHTYDRMRKVLEVKGPLYEVVKGYNIAVMYAGVLGHTRQRPDAAQIDYILHEMASCYLEKIIKKDLRYFQKYLFTGMFHWR